MSRNFGNFTIIDNNNDGTTWKYRKNFDDIDAAFIDTQGVSTDDWLIFPAVTLDKENLYKLQFTIHGVSYNYNECAELYIGTAPNPDAMTKKVVEVIDIFNSRQDPLTEAGTFSIDQSGTYYIGMHASSGYKRYGIYVLNVELSVDRVMATPAAVTDLAVNPDIHGALNGVVTFRAPSTTVEGTAITSPMDIVIRRDGAEIAILNGVNPGEAKSVNESTTEGKHTYTIAARNASGEGVAAEASAFFGFDLPKAPATITVKENSTPGKVDVSWTPVTEDINGKILPEGEVSYKLYGPGGTVVVSKLRDTKYTATATRGEQIFANYGVTTITNKGEGEEFILSDIIPVGNAYSIPWTETFAGGEFSSIIRYDDFGGYMRFGIYSTADTELEDADGSGYYLIGRAYDPDSKSRLYTGKINLADTQYPALTFSYYALPATANKVEVLASDGTEFKSLKTIVIDGPENDWMTAYVDLSQFKGKDIQLALEATVVTHQSIALDNFKVCDRPAADMTVLRFEGPEEIKVHETGTFAVTVENRAGLPTPAYSVALFRNGEKISSTDVVNPLAPGGRATFSLSDILDVTAAETNSYRCEVILDGDANPSDNISKTVEVATIQPIYPYVTTLSGQMSDNNAILTWVEPDIDTMVFEPIIESFETWTDFAIDNGADWSFIDGDGSKTYFLEDFEFPNQGKEMAAIVLPSSFFSGWNNFNSHSGGKMLASFSAINGPNDDWMISPLLIGDEQTISFFAKSMSNVYPDAFEFYYSTTGKEKDDFIQMGEAITAPHDWTEYSYDLPEGAKYFAVRYISSDGFVFMLDDFKFVPESARSLMNELSIVGYNVYRDNTRLNDTPVEEPEYRDMDVPSGEHSYAVTAVYLQGESRLSNMVKMTGSGVELTPAESATATYYDLQGIKVNNPVKGQIYIVVRGDKATKEIF